MPIFMMCHYVQKEIHTITEPTAACISSCALFLHMTHDIYFLCVLWKHARILYVLIFEVYTWIILVYLQLSVNAEVSI